MPTEMEDYLFGLRGYIVLEQAIDPDHFAELNGVIDDLLPIEPGEWRGSIHRGGVRKQNADHSNHENFFVQNMYEGGESFERLIDHPSWIDHVARYVGGDDGLFIDEAVISLRGPGQALRHSIRARTSGAFERNFDITMVFFAAGRSMC